MEGAAGVFFLGVLGVLLHGCASPTTSNKSKINVSIQEFEARAGVTKSDCQTIADRIASLLSQSGRFVVVDRDQALANKTRQVDSNSHAEEQRDSIGSQVLPIAKIIYGSVGKLGNNSFSVSVKMVDVETSSVDIAMSKIYNGDLENLPDGFLDEIVKEITRAHDKGRNN